MFEKDRSALDELEQALLEEEETPQEEEAPLVYRNFSNNYGRDLRNFASGYRTYNTDQTDVDPEDLSDQLMAEPKEKLGGWIIAALVLLLANLAVLAWWISYFMGVL